MLLELVFQGIGYAISAVMTLIILTWVLSIVLGSWGGSCAASDAVCVQR